MDLELEEAQLLARQINKMYKDKEEGKKIPPYIPEKHRARGRWWPTWAVKEIGKTMQ